MFQQIVVFILWPMNFIKIFKWNITEAKLNLFKNY